MNENKVVGRKMWRTLSQKVPRDRLNSEPSMSASFAPAEMLVVTLPMKSSVIEPWSLSMTFITRSAVTGTFLTLHISFHTGVRVSCFTVELR